MEPVRAAQLAKKYGTPLYIYDEQVMERQYRAVERALQGTRYLICFAVKANSNLSVLSVFHRLGAGFDIVSEGELRRVIAAGGDPRKVVFSGVGKGDEEIEFALGNDIKFFNVESAGELACIDAVATRLGKRARIAFRINPDVKADTHAYLSTGVKTSKFGIPATEALELYRGFKGSKALELVAVDCHIGSQITEVAPFRAAYGEILSIVKRFEAEGAQIRTVDLGGGFGISYSGKYSPLNLDTFSAMFRELSHKSPYEFVFEPGRFLIAEAGTLLTKVRFVKENQGHKFVIVDAGMNDLIRPSLYEAYHKIELMSDVKHASSEKVDVVGPVCETGCYFAKARELPPLTQGDLLAIRDAGAYGFAMASHYNTRRLPAEVIIRGPEERLVRRRETYDDLWRNEVVEA